MILASVIGFAAALMARGDDPRATAPRPFRVELPIAQSFSHSDPSKALLAVSPDGRYLAYIDGGSIWVREGSDLSEPRELENTFGARGLFFSPDSRTIGFVRG